MEAILNPKIIDIAYKLKVQFLDELPSSDEISLFLCGGSRVEEKKFRRQLGKQISDIRSKYMYSVYYPEDMFIELILGHQRQDLLSLENLLANGVHCVVILLQSPGTFTELGAFSNYKKLSNKLVVVIDPRHKGKRSFISLGPVRYLESKTQSKVLYSHMHHSNLEALTKDLSEAIRSIARHSQPVNDLSNPILSYRFYLALIYVFDQIRKDLLFDVLRGLGISQQDIEVSAETVINSLINERKVAFVSGKLSVTPSGIDSLIYDNKTKRRARATLSLLSELRLEALNLTLRKSYYRMWAE